MYPTPDLWGVFLTPSYAAPDFIDLENGFFKFSGIEAGENTFVPQSFGSVHFLPTTSTIDVSSNIGPFVFYRPTYINDEDSSDTFMSSPVCIEVQSDGKFLMGYACGNNNTGEKFHPENDEYLVRIESDGSKEDVSTFEVNVSTTNDGLSGIYEIQEYDISGTKKILVRNGCYGYLFDEAEGSSSNARNHLARFNSDGSFDTSFTIDTDNRINSMEVYSPYLVIIGDFTKVYSGGSWTNKNGVCVIDLTGSGSLYGTLGDSSISGLLENVVSVYSNRAYLASYASGTSNVLKYQFSGTLDDSTFLSSNFSGIISQIYFGSSGLFVGGYTGSIGLGNETPVLNKYSTAGTLNATFSDNDIDDFSDSIGSKGYGC